MNHTENCPICGKHTLWVWYEGVEFWGHVSRERMEECKNPNCGEEEEQ